MTERNRETSAPWWRSWRTARWADWVGFGARLILGGVLFIAGALKINNLEYNVLAVKAYQLVSPEAAQIIGYLQPPLEMLLGLALILGLFTRVMGALGAITMAIFIFGIASAAIRGINIDCGCFSRGGEVAAGETTYTLDIIRDIGLLLLGLWLFIRPRTALSLDGWLGRGGGAYQADDDEDDEDASQVTSRAGAKSTGRSGSKSKSSGSKGSGSKSKSSGSKKATVPASADKASPSRSGASRKGRAATAKTRATAATAASRSATSAPVKAKVGAQKRSGSSRSRKR